MEEKVEDVEEFERYAIGPADGGRSTIKSIFDIKIFDR